MLGVNWSLEGGISLSLVVQIVQVVPDQFTSVKESPNRKTFG